MSAGIIGWALSALLAFTCLSAAVSLWRPGGRLATGSRAAALASLLETAAVAVFFRLVVQWTPGTVALWVVATAAFAAAVAGAVVRWPGLARRTTGEPARAGEEPDQPDQGPGRVTKEPEQPDREPERATKGAGRGSNEPGRVAVAVRGGLLISAVILSVVAGPPL